MISSYPIAWKYVDVARRTKTDMDNSQENTTDDVGKIHDEKFF